MRLCFFLVAVTAIGFSSAVAQAPATAPTGRLTGTIIDKESTRPISNVQIAVVGTTIGTISDLDGRYRTPAITTGVYSLRVVRLGYRPLRVDSITVRAGDATVLNLTMEAAAASLSSMVVTADREQRASSE